MYRRSATLRSPPAPPFGRAALSLASRAPSPHPRSSLPRSSAATSARLRRALRSISSNSCCDTSRPGKRGTSAGNQQWIHTSRALYRSRKTLRENRPHLPRTALRGRPAISTCSRRTDGGFPCPRACSRFCGGRHRGRGCCPGYDTGAEACVSPRRFGCWASCWVPRNFTSPIKTAAPHPCISPIKAAAPGPYNVAAPKDPAF